MSDLVGNPKDWLSHAVLISYNEYENTYVAKCSNSLSVKGLLCLVRRSRSNVFLVV